jgi:hypothetical protein
MVAHTIYEHEEVSIRPCIWWGCCTGDVYCTRWFKYDRDKLWLVYTQIVPVIFEPPCNTEGSFCGVPYVWSVDGWVLRSWDQMIVTFLLHTLHFLGRNRAQLWQLISLFERSLESLWQICLWHKGLDCEIMNGSYNLHRFPDEINAPLYLFTINFGDT